MDTFEPLQGMFYFHNTNSHTGKYFLEFISGKLPTVPEENGTEWNRQLNVNWCYTDLDLMNTNSNMQVNFT